MRSRALTLLGAAVLLLAAPACGDDGGSDITRTGSADRSATTSADAAPDDSAPDDSAPDDGASDDGTSSDPSDLPIPSIPGMPGLGDLPGLTDLPEDCTAALAFGYVAAAAATDLTPEQQEQIEAARDSLPEDIRDDYDVLASAFEKLGDQDIIGFTEAIGSPEVATAQQNITAYIEEACPQAG